ncbi:MAG: GHKL domain-containing protein [Lachnospiraceae bacterium]|nr:GHKL domain-containing protein [Lachnospiraceae bacterium]
MQTTKPDSKHHGIGMQNLIEVLKKYKGEYQIVVKNGEFAIHMLLPLYKEDKKRSSEKPYRSSHSR